MGYNDIASTVLLQVAGRSSPAVCRPVRATCCPAASAERAGLAVGTGGVGEGIALLGLLTSRAALDRVHHAAAGRTMKQVGRPVGVETPGVKFSMSTGCAAPVGRRCTSSELFPSRTRGHRVGCAGRVVVGRREKVFPARVARGVGIVHCRDRVALASWAACRDGCAWFGIGDSIPGLAGDTGGALRACDSKLVRF